MSRVTNILPWQAEHRNVDLARGGGTLKGIVIPTTDTGDHIGKPTGEQGGIILNGQ